MKIIALQGSPRIGGNCDVLMDEMIKGAEENGVTRSSMNWLQQMV